MSEREKKRETEGGFEWGCWNRFSGNEDEAIVALKCTHTLDRQVSPLPFLFYQWHYSTAGCIVTFSDTILSFFSTLPRGGYKAPVVFLKHGGWGGFFFLTTARVWLIAPPTTTTTTLVPLCASGDNRQGGGVTYRPRISGQCQYVSMTWGGGDKNTIISPPL